MPRMKTEMILKVRMNYYYQRNAERSVAKQEPNVFCQTSLLNYTPP
jgi:hypothetical protein